MACLFFLSNFVLVHSSVCLFFIYLLERSGNHTFRCSRNSSSPPCRFRKPSGSETEAVTLLVWETGWEFNNKLTVGRIKKLTNWQLNRQNGWSTDRQRSNNWLRRNCWTAIFVILTPQGNCISSRRSHCLLSFRLNRQHVSMECIPALNRPLVSQSTHRRHQWMYFACSTFYILYFSPMMISCWRLLTKVFLHFLFLSPSNNGPLFFFLILRLLWD